MSSEFPAENHPEGRLLPNACMWYYHGLDRLHLLDMNELKLAPRVPPITREAVRLVQLMRLAHDSLSLTGRNREVLGHGLWLHQPHLIFEIATMI